MQPDYMIDLPFMAEELERFGATMTVLVLFPTLAMKLLDEVEAAPGEITGAQRAVLDELRDRIKDMSRVADVVGVKIGSVQPRFVREGGVQ